MLDSHNQICHWCATSDSARSCIPGRASRIKQRRFQPMDGAGGGLGRNIPAVEGAGPWDVGRGHPPPAEGAAVGARAGDEAGACGEVREAKWRGRPCGTAVLSSRGLLWSRLGVGVGTEAVTATAFWFSKCVPQNSRTASSPSQASLLGRIGKHLPQPHPASSQLCPGGPGISAPQQLGVRPVPRCGPGQRGRALGARDPAVEPPLPRSAHTQPRPLTHSLFCR